MDLEDATLSEMSPSQKHEDCDSAGSRGWCQQLGEGRARGWYGLGRELRFCEVGCTTTGTHRTLLNCTLESGSDGEFEVLVLKPKQSLRYEPSWSSLWVLRKRGGWTRGWAVT